jgi:hypothetical protein
MMGRRPPIQLRGSAGISPASRTPDAASIFIRAVARSQPDAGTFGSGLIFGLDCLKMQYLNLCEGEDRRWRHSDHYVLAYMVE